MIFAGIALLVLVGMVAVVWLLAAGFSNLGDRYIVRDGKVYWRQVISHSLEKVDHVVEEADAASFRSFRFPGGQYGADRSHVFYEGRLLRGADPATFEIVDHQQKVSRDANNEYVDGRKVKNDSEQFVSLDGQYSKDVNGVYWFDRRIPRADTKSFELIDATGTEYKNSGNYARDQASVYCSGRVLPRANAEEFRLIGADYGSDGERVYYKHELLIEADAGRFELRQDETYHLIGDDGTNRYQLGERIVE